MTAEDLRAILDLVARERGSAEGFDVCIGGQQRDPDWERQRAYIQSLADAGATWWNEWVPPGDLEQARVAISRGPLRVD